MIKIRLHIKIISSRKAETAFLKIKHSDNVIEVQNKYSTFSTKPHFVHRDYESKRIILQVFVTNL